MTSTTTAANLFGDSDSSDEELQDDPQDLVEQPVEQKIEDSDDDDDDEDNEFDDKAQEHLVEGISSARKTEDDAPEQETQQKKDLSMTLPHMKRTELPMYLTKLPNLIGIQPQPFDPATYDPDMELEEFGQSVYNLIRYRYSHDNGELKRDDDGKLVRESNARLVEWEDGSWTLHVGQEAFSVDIQNQSESSVDKFAALNGYVYQSTTAQGDSGTTQTVLEAMGPLRARIAARPSSLQSKAHQALTVAIRQKTIKTSKIAEYVTEEDPEKIKEQRARMKQDMAKKSKTSGAATMPRRRNRLEYEDANYDDFNVREAKKRSKEGDYEELDYGDDDSESSDDDLFNRRKKGDVEESDDEMFGDEEQAEENEEDDDEEGPVVKKPAAHTVLDDDDDDDDEE